MITIAIITNRPLLPKTLASIEAFDDIVVINNGNSPLSIPNARIINHPFNGFGPLRNLAASYAKYDWIFALDADEVISSQLLEELNAVTLDPNCIYSMPFHNYFNGKWIKGCGWYPDRHTRLYNRKITAFTNAQVHEGVIKAKLREIKLTSPVDHYSYQSIEDFLKKMQTYSTLFAQQNRGKKSSFGKALFRGSFAFFKSYIIKRGFLDGYEGYLISTYNAQTTYYKYLKLHELNQCS